MFGLPSAWLYGGIAISVAVFVAGVTLKHQRDLRLAIERGEAAGTGQAATAAVKAATETQETRRQALEETPLPADRAAKIELCKKRASCKEHGSLK